MELSYWEIKTWLANLDYTVVGSGIVGLNCALCLKKRFPKSKVLVLEKGMLPQGASTKNAGFACFGSLSELIEDLKTHTEAEVLQLVQNRFQGLELLRQTLGDKTIAYQELGGYELFLDSDTELYESCLEKMEQVNTLLSATFNTEVFSLKRNIFNFNHIKQQYCFNRFEGQIDTGKMMSALLAKAYKSGIKILNNCTVEAFSEDLGNVKIKTDKFDFVTKQLLIATNGFASKLIHKAVEPARAQVLITKPIKDLHIKGTFHLDRGYYYFRNIDNRILLGGARHLDFKSETTTQFGQTKGIQDALEALLRHTILPHMDFEIEHRWSGIMGMGNQKKPIVKQLSDRVFCGVRLGGMGIAIGSLVGKTLADLVE